MDYENINDNDNVGTLYERLKLKGSNLVLKTIKQIENNILKPKEQPQIEKEFLKKAPKIRKEDCEINWNDTAQNIFIPSTRGRNIRVKNVALSSAILMY